MRAILILLLLTGAARAQTPAAQAQTPPANSSSDSLTTAMAATPQCAAPPSADGGPPPHTAEFFLTIADGTHVGSAYIIVSSGNAKFDQRAVSCLKGISIAPISRQKSAGVVVWVYSKDGAIALQPDRPPQWGMAITDRPPQSDIVLPVSVGMPHACSGRNYHPPADIQQGQVGFTTLTFDITPEGTVTNIKVKQSSGVPTFDQDTVDCVSQWRYKPATKDGVPIVMPWQTIVRWQF